MSGVNGKINHSSEALAPELSLGLLPSPGPPPKQAFTVGAVPETLPARWGWERGRWVFGRLRGMTI